MNRILFVLCFLGLSITMFGQQPSKDEIHEKVISAKIAYFTQELSLTSEEAQAFWPIYNKWWDDRQSANSATRKALKSIKKLNKEGNYSEVEMKKLIKTYTSCMKNESDVYEVYIEEFYKILPVEKVAKIFVAEDGFRKKLTQMWREWNYEKETKKPEGKR